MTCYKLCSSTLFLLLPLIVFLSKSKPNKYEIGLALLLIISTIVSLTFWYNPIQNSTIHLYDGIIGKITFIMFSIYIFFIKVVQLYIRLFFLVILFITLVLFYYSNKESTIKWCSCNHISWHVLFHLSISIGASMAFI